MNKTSNKTRNKWFIQIEDKETHERISICDFGLVYGTETNQTLGILKQEIVDKIKQILDGNLDIFGNEFTNKTIPSKVNFKHFFKQEVYTKYYDNNLVLKIRDDSKKQRKIKVIGWHVTELFIKMLRDDKNWKKLF